MLFIPGLALVEGTVGRHSALAWHYRRETTSDGEHAPELSELSAKEAIHPGGLYTGNTLGIQGTYRGNTRGLQEVGHP